MHGSFWFLEGQLPRLADGILLTAERHLAYPILHFFHSVEREEDFRVQLGSLDEAVTILQHGIPTVEDATFHQRLQALAEQRRRPAAFAPESPWHGRPAGP